MNKIIAVMSLLTLFQSSAWAGERYEFYNGVRALGMGGAGVAVVNDETALMVNPAGLGKLRDFFLTVMDPEVDAGADTSAIVGGNALKAFDPQEVLSMLNAGHQDERMHLRAQVFPSFVVPNFGIGVFAKYEVNAEVDSTTNLMSYDYFNDMAVVAGFNFRLFDGIIKFGFNARMVNRVEIQRTDITVTSTGLTVDSLAKEGFGVASDVGLILSAPVVMLPTLGVVLRDAGGTTYGLKEGLFTASTTDPTTTKQTLDVALALHPIFGRGVRGTFTAEYRDVLTEDEAEIEDPMRRAHVGIEANIRDAFFIRAGMNQRYWTAGLELAVLNYQLQIASYGEEIGVLDAELEDRRYVLKFAYRY